MGLLDAVDDDENSTLAQSLDKFSDPEKCNGCGSSNTEERRYYRVCKAEDCDVISYHNPPDIDLSLG